MNIVIADSHALYREALSSFIRHSDPDLLVDSVGDYGEFLKAIDRNEPDMVLFDPDLPGMAEACDAIMFFQKSPALRIGVLANDATADNSFYTSHVHGYFPRTLSSKEFIEGINRVLQNLPFKPSGKNYEQEGRPRKPIEELSLTVREKQVLNHLMRGASNKDIARALDLQVVTIKLHVRGLCRKMGVKNRTQAALVAMENGWE